DRMRPNTVSAGICTTPRHRPVSTITFSSTLVNSPKKPFQSPGTQKRTSPVAAAMFIPDSPVMSIRAGAKLRDHRRCRVRRRAVTPTRAHVIGDLRDLLRRELDVE